MNSRVPTRHRVVAAGVSAAIVAGAGLASAAAHAETASLQAKLTPQTSAGVQLPKSSSSDFLTTVGQTVARTTNQSGEETPFSIYMINGQVSGEGSGTVSVPTSWDGEADDISVSSTSGEVSNFVELGGAYSEDLPISVTTEVKLDGESIDPDTAYDITGDVKVTYTFENNTAEDQELTYTNIYGTQTTKTVSVPVPFGVVFDATFGHGWSLTKVKGVTNELTPAGAKLNGQVILFPIIEGKVGGTTQTVVVKGEAQNASIPATKSVAVPVQLSTFANGVALELNDDVQKRLITPLDQTLNQAIQPISTVAQLISDFSGEFRNLNEQDLNPLLEAVEAINVDPVVLSENLAELEFGLDSLSVLMAANALGQQTVAALISQVAELVGVDAVELVDWLATLINEAGPASAQAAKGLRGMNKILKQLDAAALTADLVATKEACTTVGATSEQYGHQPLTVTVKVAGIPITVPITEGGAGAAALNTVIKDNTPLIGKTPQWVKDLKTLRTQLDDQTDATLLPSLLSDLIGNNVSNPTVKSLLQSPACQTVREIVRDGVIPLAAVWNLAVAPEFTKLANFLDLFAAFARSPEAAAVKKLIDKTLPRIADLLSNDNCTPADIIDPLVAALAGGNVNLARLLGEITQNCGVAQLIQFFGGFDALIAQVSRGVAQTVGGVQQDVPTIAAAADGVSTIATDVQQGLNAVPGLLDDAVVKIDDAGANIQSQGQNAIGQVSSDSAYLGAYLDAMNQRVIDGDGAPFGGASGPNETITLAAYQITQEAAKPYERNWLVSIIGAVVFLIVALGVGGWLYRRRVNQGVEL